MNKPVGLGAHWSFRGNSTCLCSDRPRAQLSEATVYWFLWGTALLHITYSLEDCTVWANCCQHDTLATDHCQAAEGPPASPEGFRSFSLVQISLLDSHRSLCPRGSTWDKEEPQ